VAGISAVGWALPRLALKADEARKATGAWTARGVVEKTVAAFDEDEVTLGTEAAARALEAVGYHGGRVHYVAFASVGAPAGAAALTALALEATHAQAADFRGGPPFAAALFAALQIAGAGGGTALVVAADTLRARPDDPCDHALGAGAAAFLIEKLAKVQFVGESFATVPSLEPSRLGPDGLVRSSVGDDPSPAALRLALSHLFLAGATQPGDRGLTGFLPNSFDRAAGAERAGVMLAPHLQAAFPADAIQAPLWPRTGDTGAASAALALIAALEGAQADDQLLLADSEGASSAAFALKVAERPRGVEGLRATVEASRTHLTWAAYLGHRRYLPDASPTHTKSEGAYVSAAAWEETLEARITLIASRCPECKTARHPPREACPDCGSAVMETFHARPTGSVHAFTRIGRGGAPSEFALQQQLVGEYAVAAVDMDDGFRVVAQISGADPKAVKLGDAVHLRLRRLFEQEGRTRYGLKAVPVGPEHEAATAPRKD
jgi:hydroxymethylglutaryl-CoA synthase